MHISGNPIASSTNLQTGWEHLRFTASANGQATIKAHTISVSSSTNGRQGYALALVNLSRSSGMGRLSTYGSGCLFTTLIPEPGSAPRLGNYPRQNQLGWLFTNGVEALIDR